MKTFGTEGPVSPEKNYIVSRTAELTDFIDRIKQEKIPCYIRTTPNRQNHIFPIRT